MKGNNSNHILDEDLTTIGNGDAENGRYIMAKIADRLFRARYTHPNFPDNGMTTYEVIAEEWREFSEEMEKGDYPRACYEALDVIATMIRFILDEDIVDGSEKHS